jgi:Phosphotransferase enzyme family
MRTNLPWTARSLDALLQGATERVPVHSTDAKSGASFEKLIIDGRPCFLKVVSTEDDWIMRVTGNEHWEFQVWRAGLYQRVPSVIDPAMIGMALDDSGGATHLAMLMHDRSADLVPPGDSPIPASQNAGFIQHLAQMHAANLGWHDNLGLYPLERRTLFFAPATIAPELARDDVPLPLQVAERGWALLQERDAVLFELASAVHRDPSTLAGLLSETPQTFIAGDWKMGNLGTRSSGETVLLDWAYPGEAPPAWELAWYLALNRARIPESKSDTIARYRQALEEAGVATDAWWDRQLDLCLLAMAATMGWEKAVGDADELAWWSEHAQEAATRWL